MKPRAELIVVGTPLDEEAALSARAAEAFAKATLYIGESRKIAMRYLSKIEGWRDKPLFLLDQQRPDDENAMAEALRALAASGGSAALFSDCGMPILFDPGEAVLRHCRELGFRVRSCGAETSWGTAAALSGYGTPFLVAGFPPRDNDERRQWLQEWRGATAHTVLLDTPYRFEALLAHCREVFGGGREAFLAWELGKESERLEWGTFDALISRAKSAEMKKGEFVLVVRGLGKPEGKTARGNSSRSSRPSAR